MLVEVLVCSEKNSEHAADTNLLNSSKALSLINRFKECLCTTMRSRNLVFNPSLLISMVKPTTFVVQDFNGNCVLYFTVVIFLS